MCGARKTMTPDVICVTITTAYSIEMPKIRHIEKTFCSQDCANEWWRTFDEEKDEDLIE